MSEFPALIPVITPLLPFTVATDTLEEVHVPPDTVDENIEFPPTQID
jgi:hypothetical protein